MAQSALTVTPPSPTPPTNMSSVGATGPNPPNYTKNTYANPVANPPPFFDDGAAGSLVAFAANTAALASGSGATAGGNEGSYPPVPPGAAVPASSSVAHEGAGTEVVVTATVPNPSPNGQLQTVSCLGNYPATGTINGSHASSLSPVTNPALASIAPTTAVSGASGTDNIVCTGTNFTKQSVVWVQHGTLPPVACPTTFTSATTINAPVPKRTTAGASTIFVITGGVVTTVTKALTYT